MSAEEQKAATKRYERDRAYNKRTGYKAQRKYIYSKCRVVTMTLNLENDEDILKKLDAQENRTQYLKDLIRSDING